MLRCRIDSPRFACLPVRGRLFCSCRLLADSVELELMRLWRVRRFAGLGVEAAGARATRLSRSPSLSRPPAASPPCFLPSLFLSASPRLASPRSVSPVDQQRTSRPIASLEIPINITSRFTLLSSLLLLLLLLPIARLSNFRRRPLSPLVSSTLSIPTTHAIPCPLAA